MIPVTLLTGFLGAGEATLLNRLLRDPDPAMVERGLAAFLEAAA